MSGPQFQFDWDDAKAARNTAKHGISFEAATTIFNDPQLLTMADLTHGEGDERWFSVGCASNGVLLSIVYLWSEAIPPVTDVRLISARKATQAEIRYYQGSI